MPTDPPPEIPGFNTRDTPQQGEVPSAREALSQLAQSAGSLGIIRIMEEFSRRNTTSDATADQRLIIVADGKPVLPQEKPSTAGNAAPETEYKQSELEKALLPPTLADQTKITDAIRDLDDPRFKTREAASKTLAEYGAYAVPELIKAAKMLGPEVRMRANKLLEKRYEQYDGPTSEQAMKTWDIEWAKYGGKVPPTVRQFADMAALMQVDAKAALVRTAEIGKLTDYYGGPDSDNRRVEHLREKLKDYTPDIKAKQKEIASRTAKVTVLGGDSEDVPAESTRLFKYTPNLTALELRGMEINDTVVARVSEMVNLRYLSLEGTNVTDKGLEALKKNDHLKEIRLSHTKVTDEGLKNLTGMTNLQSITLNDTNVTDNGLKTLSTLKGIKTLGLAGTNITDKGLDNLKEMDNLSKLDISNTKVTKAGLKKLENFCKLDHLLLNGNTQITNDDIDQLSKMKNLKSIELIDTGITEEGFKRLGQALPECLISCQYIPLLPEEQAPEPPKRSKSV